MIVNIRARFSKGMLQPLEPLDLEEGKEVLVSIEDLPAPAGGLTSILEMFERMHDASPSETWANLPAGGAKYVDHYLYGWPKLTGDAKGFCRHRLLDSDVQPQ